MQSGKSGSKMLRKKRRNMLEKHRMNCHKRAKETYNLHDLRKYTNIVILQLLNIQSDIISSRMSQINQNYGHWKIVTWNKNYPSFVHFISLKNNELLYYFIINKQNKKKCQVYNSAGFIKGNNSMKNSLHYVQGSTTKNTN